MTERVMLQRRGDVFVPATPHDADQLADLPYGAYIRANPKQPRHPEHHKKCFAMLHQIYDNLPDGMDLTWERFYAYIKVAAGAVDETINHKGEVFYVVKSLSFADMDQMEFQRIYQAFIDVAVQRLGMEWVEEFA